MAWLNNFLIKVLLLVLSEVPGSTELHSNFQGVVITPLVGLI